MWRHEKMRRCWQYGYMDTASYVRHGVTGRFAPFWKAEPLILTFCFFVFLHAARYAPFSLAPAPTTRPEAKLSPVVVAMGRLSVNLGDRPNCDGSRSKAPRSSYFSPQIPLSLRRVDDDSTTLIDCLVRMDFGAATPFLFPRYSLLVPKYKWRPSW